MPLPPDALIGRESELHGLRRLIDSERLVTVLGPGGVGKTHLVLTAAAQLANRRPVTVVRLAGLQDGAAVATVVANELGLTVHGADVAEQCADRLRSGQQVLVLDNCEHLRADVADLATRLLERCPTLTVVTTSRERLGVGAEQTCRLGPLPLPPADGADDRVPSVALFVSRARRIRPDWSAGADDLRAVSRIVRHLDGVPLSIELAAGRLSAMSLADLERRLDDALDLLGSEDEPAGSTGRPADRHRTLRSAIRWSYDLLPESERLLFRHLAVFPDGFDLDTAEVIARGLGLDGHPVRAISHLVDSSMVEAEIGESTRYRMLDTIRTFGVDQLRAVGELDAAEHRFVEWAVRLAEELDAAPWQGAEPLTDRRFRAELGNLRAAWNLLRATGDLDRLAAMADNLYELVTWRDTVEVWTWIRELTTDPALTDHPAAARVLAVAAEATWFSTGDYRGAEALALRAVDCCRPGDERDAALAHFALAEVRLLEGRFDESEAEFQRSAVGRRRGESLTLASMAAAYGGALERAERHLMEARRHPRNESVEGLGRYMDGEIARLGGQWDEALAAFDDALVTARRTGAQFLEGIASVSTVSVHAAAGRVGEALSGYAALIDYWERTGSWTQQWTTLRNLADLLERVGDAATANLLRAAADAAPEAAVVAAVRHRGSRGVPDGVGALPDTVPDRETVVGLARAAIAARLP